MTVNKEITILVGPCGSGKSTWALQHLNLDNIYVNRDTQGKEGHLNIFKLALEQGRSIIIDRMNFNKEQRNRYLLPAKELGYKTKIVVFHVPYDICLDRCENRKDHPNIKDVGTASEVLHFFFKKYERVEDNEADEVIRLGWDGEKKTGLIIDLDGTLCNIDNRLHFVKDKDVDSETTIKKDWKNFFKNIPNDVPNKWCQSIIWQYNKSSSDIILCSGRPDDYKRITEDWLEKWHIDWTKLFMRQRGDYRRDDIIKEVILDFEILPRYNILFAIDDRQSIVDLWRRRGIVALQCQPGDF